MSSAMVSAAAAQGRLFFSGAEAIPADAHPEARSFPENQEHTGALGRFFQSKISHQKSTILAAVTSASHLAVRAAPEMLSSGIAAINALTGGWPRGCLTEICGPASSGRTTVLLAALAAATRRGEYCVLVDASDALDPRSAADAGVDLDRLLWVRCGESPPPNKSAKNERENKNENKNKSDKNRRPEHSAPPHADHRLEQALHATDLLLESGGFGLVVLDLSDLPPQQARRIPLTTWFRFRRAVENTSTVLLALEQHPIAGSCSSLQLQLGSMNPIHRWNNHQFAADSLFPKPGHAQLLTSLEITAELMRSRLERKPALSTAAFTSKTAWAG